MPTSETVGEFAGRWLEDFPRPKQSTVAAYRGAVRRFLGGVKGVADRSPRDVSVPVARAHGTAHPHDVAPLRAMFSDMRRAGHDLPENPFSDLGVASGQGRRRLKAITREELSRLEAIALQIHWDDYGPVFAAAIRFAAYSTMRPGEIFGLDRADVDFKKGMVHIRRQFYQRRKELPKNGLTRELPYLPPQAAEAAQAVLDRPATVCPKTKGEILFPAKLGGRVSQQVLSDYWHPVRRAFEEGLSAERRMELREARPKSNRDMVFYELRHAGATWLIEAGVESWIVALMLGHEDGGRLVEKTYGHPSEKVARKRLEEVQHGEA